MKKIFGLSLMFAFLFFIANLNVFALTTWKYEDWQDGKNYGLKTKTSSNITNLKGEKEENDGMKLGPYNKASKAKISDGITEEVYVGLKKDDYQNSELFELSIAINKKENSKDAEYLTEAVVMTQKSGDKFVITANNWTKDKKTIATIDADGVYTYKWEFKKSNNKILVKFTVLDYGKVLGTTDFVELDVDASNASDVRYLWACNIKANYGVDIYTSLPPKPDTTIENPQTADINIFFYLGLIGISTLGLLVLKKEVNN